MKALKFLPLFLSAVVTTSLATSAFAQSTAQETQRNAHQQQRIEDGLKSGQLTVKEAAKLEREEANISRAESKALKDGKLSDAEKDRIAAMQDRTSHDIHAEKSDVRHGNPDSVSNQRMQADVARNLNQQKRIEEGVKNGSLTNKEVAKLEKGQAKVEHKEAASGHNGHISATEQKRIQHAENKQSKRIHHEKTDKQDRG